MKFKKGQKVRVIAKKHGHCFKIGEIVEIERIDKDSNDGNGDYMCSDDDGSYWWLTDNEIELVEANN